ncbi:MAG: response regulator [Acidobacteria bacterium]|nr:response regulator [Acidobacteriota bacterium]
MRILVVDDYAELRKRIRALLSRRADWSVCAEAEDGIEAVEKAKKLRPDVILMDVSMPRMDGIEATSIVRREVPESDVIIVSQNDPLVVSMQAREGGSSRICVQNEPCNRPDTNPRTMGKAAPVWSLFRFQGAQ